MFEVFRNDAGGKYYYRLRSPAGETILASEGYERKAFALNGIQAVKRHAVESSNYEIRPVAGGKWHFVLHACNGEPIGSSQLYTGRDGVRHGMAAVVKHVTDGIRDLTV
ncbi:MAG TPA: YegP family protein [Luteolibacter sp.]